MPENSFYGLGIAPNILAILDKLNFKIPTPIQEKSIPQSIGGKDLIGIAETGTGKTLAFGIPMIQAALNGTRGLIVLPTRELALQVNEALQKIGKPLSIHTALLIGGEAMYKQMAQIKRGPMIVIGTPGRIIDHLMQKTIRLNAVGMLVLDEADRMLDMGFAPQIQRILTEVLQKRQTMLFSATMPDEIVKIANKYMQLPTRVEIARSGTPAERITQELFFVQKNDKPRLLQTILNEYKGSILIFSRTKYGARRITQGIRAWNHNATEIHSDKSLSQRKEALEGFRNGKYRILVATDIAARGIDVKGIEVVINYDLPGSPEDYVHRIGRTGRAGGSGHAISFATPDQHGDIRGIERLIRGNLPLAKLPEGMQQLIVPSANTTPRPMHRRSFRGGPSRRFRGYSR